PGPCPTGGEVWGGGAKKPPQRSPPNPSPHPRGGGGGGGGRESSPGRFPRNAPPLPTGERVGVRGVKVVRVAIVDDQAMVRAGFRLIVQSQKDMQVAGEAADGQEAIDLVRRERPDVVLMDIRMPRVDGIEATRQVAGIP